MPSVLIINADDFGLTPGINRAIGDLHRAGALSSATLMATGPALDDAIRIARENPSLGIGCHIVLVDGVPLSHPASIPTLLGPDGKTFRPSLVNFVQAILRGAVREDDIEREAFAQIQKLQHAGIELTHLDTHKHTHLFPTVSRPLLHVAARCGIGAMRNPFEPSFALSLGHGSLLRRTQMHLLARLESRFLHLPQLLSGKVRTPKGTIGISTTGHLNAPTLAQLLASSPGDDAVYELCCHPGYNDAVLETVSTRLRSSRDTEREALISLVPAFLKQPHAPQLRSYSHLNDSVPSRSR